MFKNTYRAKKKFSDIITFIAPRHINRVNEIQSLSKDLNLKTQILNLNEKISGDIEIIIINSYGVLQKYFQYAKSVFIGKSVIKRLKDDSGQSPIDAAYLDCKIYHGPYVSNFNEIYEILKNNNISEKVENYLELSKHLTTDLKDFKKKIKNKPNTMRSLGQNILLKTSKIVKYFLNDKII